MELRGDGGGEGGGGDNLGGRERGCVCVCVRLVKVYGFSGSLCRYGNTPVPSKEGVANDRTTRALCLGAKENIRLGTTNIWAPELDERGLGRYHVELHMACEPFTGFACLVENAK